MPRNILILGAAGRDFHDFLVRYRDDENVRVVGFTAEQIPGIDDRRFPAELSGPRYPEGIAIYPEARLAELIPELEVDTVCLAYSDLSHQTVMEKASRVLAAGASFELLGGNDTYVTSKHPVVAVLAVRTGCGKSQTTRALAEQLRARGRHPIAIRHSMPYGRDLRVQTVQRFATAEDFAAHHTTIEEEEEYQPWLDHGMVIYAGFDYRGIVAQAEAEGDLLLFDGGNNDQSMIRPDVTVCVVDPHRAGHESSYYPGLVNLLSADIVVINKIDSATGDQLRELHAGLDRWSPDAPVVEGRSEIRVPDPAALEGKRCLAIGDGPTLSHGGMPFGAGTLAIEAHGGTLVDPRPHLVGSLADTYARYPHLGLELPAMGYHDQQLRELEETINAVDCDVVVDGSPANLGRVIDIRHPLVQVGYELDADATRQLADLVTERLTKLQG